MNTRCKLRGDTDVANLDVLLGTTSTGTWLSARRELQTVEPMLTYKLPGNGYLLHRPPRTWTGRQASQRQESQWR